MQLAYGVCVGSWDKFNQYVVPRTQGREVLALSGQGCIAVAYNKILEAFRDRSLDGLVLLHDDLEITDPDHEPKFLAALTDLDVALVGVCGGRSDWSLAWWTSERVGHQMTDSGMLDFGPRSDDVAIIEGSIMVLSPWAVQHLRFDETYPGFLGYDDICLTARAAGKRVTVIDVDTHHHSTVGLKSAAVSADWDISENIFQKKWWGR